MEAYGDSAARANAEGASEAGSPPGGTPQWDGEDNRLDDLVDRSPQAGSRDGASSDNGVEQLPSYITDPRGHLELLPARRDDVMPSYRISEFESGQAQFLPLFAPNKDYAEFAKPLRYLQLARYFGTSPNVVAAYPDEFELRFAAETANHAPERDVGLKTASAHDPDNTIGNDAATNTTTQGNPHEFKQAGGSGDGNDAGASRPQSARTLEIRKGDTLSEIAQDNGVTVDDIMKVNPQIKDRDRIYAGDTITLPPSTQGVLGGEPADNNPAPGARKIVIERGDTLSEIAQDNGVTVDDIMKANPQIKDRDRIYAGDTITLPPSPQGERGGEPGDNNLVPDAKNPYDAVVQEMLRQQQPGASSSGTDSGRNGVQAPGTDGLPPAVGGVLEGLMSGLVGRADAGEMPPGTGGSKQRGASRPGIGSAQNTHPGSWTVMEKLKALADLLHLTGVKTDTYKKGDTWERIAKRNGVTAKQVKDANPHIKNLTELRHGGAVNVPLSKEEANWHDSVAKMNQELKKEQQPGGVRISPYDLAVYGAPVATEDSGAHAVARRGETLLDVSERTGVPIEILAHINHLENKGIGEGVKIILPPRQSPGEMFHDLYEDTLDRLHLRRRDYSINDAVDYLNSHAETDYTGQCSSYVFRAIAAGRHIKFENQDRPVYAKQAAKFLRAAGFKLVATSLDGYRPQKGDVVVLQDYPGQHDKDGNPLPAGHIAMFNGRYWVSDAVQKGPSGMWSNFKFRDFKVGMEIYRP